MSTGDQAKVALKEDAVAVGGATGARRLSTGEQIAAIVSKFGMVGILAIVVIAAEILYPGFLNSGNLSNIITQNAPVGFVAIGMTFVLIGGGFDLSVGGIFALSGVIYASLTESMPVGEAALLMIPIAVAMGSANGLLITRLRVNPFVATLGSGSIFGGITYLISTNGSVLVTKESFTWLGTHKVDGIHVSIIILALAFLVSGLVLSRTVYGRGIYTIGGNPQAARLAGMRVSLLTASTYVLTALGAAMGGMLLASETQVGGANVGSEITLNAIAVVIIGGTSLRGGQGSMWRTLIGLLIVGCVTNLLASLALNGSIQSVAKGAILIFAVGLDAWTRRVEEQ